LAAAGRLAELHFTTQDLQAAEFEQVELPSLDPFLRGLLFTDGTVTRALEVHTLSSVLVEVVDQSPIPLPAEAARCLDATAGAEGIRRRVVLRSGGPGLTVWAESYILPDRLPPGFLSVLGIAPQGIGQSMQGVKLESRRELLWHRLDSAPGWAPAETPPVTTLTRFYRVITDDRPALLISEAFAVEEHAGGYRLLGLAGGAATPRRGPAEVLSAAPRDH
jgi:chorismate--pyruvate lyase